MMNRGDRKRLLREAARMRIKAERASIAERFKPYRQHGQMSEAQAIEYLRDVPTIWAFAEQLNSNYRRPAWADQRFGAR